MYKILVVVPTFETIATECYESLWNLTKQINVDVDFKAIKGYDCARARNEAVKYFLKFDECTHLMMVDSDIVLPNIFKEDDTYLTELLEHQTSSEVFLGWYPRKKAPSRSEWFSDRFGLYCDAARLSCREITQNPYEFQTLRGGGFGCAIINRDLFHNITFPYFNYELREDGTYLSEDLYFCKKVIETGYTILGVKSLACDHIGRKIIKAM